LPVWAKPGCPGLFERNAAEVTTVKLPHRDLIRGLGARMVVMLTANAIIAAMKGGAVLRVAYQDGEACYFLTESNGLASVAVPDTVAREVITSPQVLVNMAGPLPDCPQSYTYRNGE
jgi:hypothetical protein